MIILSKEEVAVKPTFDGSPGFLNSDFVQYPSVVEKHKVAALT